MQDIDDAINAAHGMILDIMGSRLEPSSKEKMDFIEFLAIIGVTKSDLHTLLKSSQNFYSEQKMYETTSGFFASDFEKLMNNPLQEEPPVVPFPQVKFPKID